MKTKHLLLLAALMLLIIPMQAQNENMSRNHKMELRRAVETGQAPSSTHSRTHRMGLAPSLRSTTADDLILPDSLVTRDVNGGYFTKNIYEYDAAENLTLETCYNWDADAQSWEKDYKYEFGKEDQTSGTYYIWNADAQSWVKNWKYEIAYDAEGNLTLDASYSWDADTQKWEGDYKVEFAYDEAGNQILEAYYYYYYDDLDSWEGDYKNEYDYNEAGDKTSATLYGWDWDAWDWAETETHEYEYNQMQNPTTGIIYSLDEERNRGAAVGKLEFDYDEQGYRVEEIYYNWDGNDWKEEYKYEYARDAENNRLTLARYGWGNSRWVGAYKYESTSDAEGRLLLYVHYIWDFSVPDWKESFKEEYDFDTGGNQPIYARYSWSSSLPDWEGTNKHEPAFDAEGNLISETRFGWDADANDWMVTHIGTYYYSAVKENITFTWTASAATAKSFIVQATAGAGNITVNWGDETTEPYDGNGSTNVTLSHVYAASGSYNVVISTTVGTALTTLNCSSNQLTSLNVSGATALTALDCISNQLPLSDLYAASKKISEVTLKNLGTQTCLVQAVITNTAYSLAGQMVLGGKATVFTVTSTSGGSSLQEGSHYVLDYEAETITFLIAGDYEVTLTNTLISSHSSYPAEVVIPFTVYDVSLASLAVSAGTLTPEFSPSVTSYAVTVGNEVATIDITANATNATVSGDTGTQTLTVGANTFTITVTAQDGVTTEDYTVVVTREDNVGIYNINTIELTLYPNPVSDVLYMKSPVAVQRVVLYDVNGRMVLSNNQNPESLKINVSALPKGMYMVKVETCDNAPVIKKIVKE